MTAPHDPYADDPQPTHAINDPAPGRGYGGPQEPAHAAPDPMPGHARPDPQTRPNPFTVPQPAEPANPFARTTPPPPSNGGPYPPVSDGGPPTPPFPGPAADMRVAPSGTTMPPAQGVPVGVPQQPGPNGGGTSFPITVPQVEPEPPPRASTNTRTMSEPAPLPIPGQGGARGGQPVRIGMWGSGRSGKSTFLASLPLAAMQGRHGTWMVSGTDDVAADYLNQSVNRLAVERRFPRGNLVIEGISWAFHGTAPPGGFGNFMNALGFRKQPTTVEFTLELFDPPGAHYRTGAVDPEALEHLANANGLIYLLDPVLDPQVGDQAFQHFFGALQMLTSRMAATGQLLNGRLPHAIAVCITKFDDESFFRRLVSQTDLVSQDPTGHRLPRVPQERSREFFNWVCARVLGGSAGMVQEGLQAYFHPDRVQYFATSAIGFRLNHNQIFDFRDFNNVQRVGQETTIRDRPRPVNVLEPLIYLEQRIRAGRR